MFLLDLLRGLFWKPRSFSRACFTGPRRGLSPELPVSLYSFNTVLFYRSVLPRATTACACRAHEIFEPGDLPSAKAFQPSCGSSS